MANDRMATIVGWAAAIIGLAAESLAIYFVDQLPMWAQLAIYVPPCIAVIVGFALLWRERVRTRARRVRAERSRATDRP